VVDGAMIHKFLKVAKRFLKKVQDSFLGCHQAS
jgi:hypothetical protein